MAGTYANEAPSCPPADKRTKALERVKAAETALAAIGDTPRLTRAQRAKADAVAAVVAKAAEKGCLGNCRQLLQAQVDAATAEVAAARAEIDALRAGAEGKVKHARADLALFPLPPSYSPLTDRLGIEPWKLDLAQAALASVAANGLTAFLLVFAAHGRRHRAPVIDAPAPVAEIGPAPVAEVAAAPATAAMEPRVRDPADEADVFARTTLRPAEAGRLKLIEIPAAYAAWCRERGLDPLPEKEIGTALSALFSSVGLYRRGKGARAIVPGIEWRSSGAPQLLTAESKSNCCIRVNCGPEAQLSTTLVDLQTHGLVLGWRTTNDRCEARHKR